MGTRTFPEVHAIMMLSAAVRHPWRHRSPPRLQVTANMGCIATARATMGLGQLRHARFTCVGI